jgi:hypothetical protein
MEIGSGIQKLTGGELQTARREHKHALKNRLKMID